MKNSEENQLDQVLKDKLSEGATQVPDFVWDRIEEELFPKKKRRGFFWWFFGGLCLLIVTLLFGIAYSGEKVDSQQASLPQNTVSNKNTAVPKDEIVQQNGDKPTLYPTKTKGCSRYREYATKPGKSSDSRNSGAAHSIRTSSQPFKKSHLKTQSESHTSFAKRSKRLDSEKENNGFTGFAGEYKSLPPHSISPNEPQAEQTPPGEKHDQEKTENEPKTTIETSVKKEINYAEVIALIKRDFPEIPDELAEKPRASFFSLGVYGGPSLYHTAVFKDYFTSGQLSKRTFASSGFELGLQARFKVGERFRIYAGLAFNQKQTRFNYNVAITQTDYFTYVINNEKVPLENIHDDGTNSCFLAKDVAARYQIQTVLISLGTSFEFLRIGRFSAAADLRLSGNVFASLKLKEMQTLDIAQPQSEKFSYLQPGAGLLLNFRLNQRISLGLAPFFGKQFYLKESFSRKMEELVVPLSASFTF